MFVLSHSQVLWTRDRRGEWGDFWLELRLSHEQDGVSVDTHTEPSVLEVFLVWSPPGSGSFFNFIDSKNFSDSDFSAAAGRDRDY